MDPTMGRIVYYTPSDPNDVSAVESPAIVSRVNSDGTLDLTVFPPGASPYSAQEVGESSTGGSENGLWCWPPAAPTGSAPELSEDKETGEGLDEEDEDTAPDTPAGDGDQGGPEAPQAPAEGVGESQETNEPASTSADSEKPLYVVAQGTVSPEGFSPSGLETTDGYTLYHYEGDTAGQPATFDVGLEGIDLYADADDNEQPVCPAAPANA